MTTSEQPISYESLLLTLDQMRGKSGEAVYERVRIACRVFNDDEFRASLNLDDFTAAEFLDRRFADLDVMGDTRGIFNTLRHMLKAFPDVADWKDGDLQGLRQKWDDLRQEREKEDDDSEPKPKRRRATAKALEDAEQRAAEAEAEASSLRERVRELERENAILEGRLSELERLATASNTGA